jgi:uncharacterized Zn ribbon protein
MIQYQVNTGHAESTQLTTLYDPWDMEEEEKLFNWNALTSLDIDKYIFLNDGNNLFAKITYVSSIYVRTTAGVFRKKDIIHCSTARYEWNGYSGASDNEESFEVRAATKNELARANQVLAGKKFKSVSKRVKMLSLSVINKRAEEQGFDEEFIADTLMEAISYKDKFGKRDGQWLNALKILSKINGNDLDEPHGKTEIGSGTNKILTIQEQRKLASLSQIEKAVVLSNCRNEMTISVYDNDVVNK